MHVFLLHSFPISCKYLIKITGKKEETKKTYLVRKKQNRESELRTSNTPNYLLLLRMHKDQQARLLHTHARLQGNLY
jgi:hypothetical protein